jgi:hypothetical protein
VYRDGVVQSLKVMPVSRRRDIVDMSSPANRIRSLVSVACADRNYLFGLPPMLDGLPSPGKATGPWLAKYGESLTGVRAGPWPGCVSRDNIIYVHMLDQPIEPPMIPATLVSSAYLTARDAKPDTILKLVYDQAIEPFALAAPSRGSLTAGAKLPATLPLELDLGRMATFDHVELTIENPGHRRGVGRHFELQARQLDGSWQIVYQSTVYGTILSKQFDPVTARQVRLVIDAPAIAQFDLFEPDVRVPSS